MQTMCKLSRIKKTTTLNIMNITSCQDQLRIQDVIKTTLIFSHTRLGLSMSLALMTIILYQYNSQLLEKLSGTSQLPICLEQGTASGYQFGITDKHVQHKLWGTHKIDFNGQLIHCFDDVVKVYLRLSYLNNEYP